MCSEHEKGIPEFLYHYTTVKGIEGIFQKNNLNIRITNTEKVNDTTEGEEIEKIIKREALKLKETNQITDKQYSSIYNHKFEFNHSYINSNGNICFNSCEIAYIFCLCEDGDSLPMWNYYSKSGENYGYNIKFNTQNLKYVLEKQYTEAIVHFEKVIYKDEDKNKIISDFILDTCAKNPPADEVIKIIESNLGEYQFLFKKLYFEYEKEWRLIVYSDSKEEYSNLYLDKLKYPAKLRNHILDYSCVNGICIGPLNDNIIMKIELKKYLEDNKYSELTGFSSSNVPIRNT